MRNRAAILATLLNIVVCSLLLITCAVTAANLQNGIIEEEMRITSRLSKEIIDCAANEDAPEELLKTVLNKGNILFAYFEKDGTVADEIDGFVPKTPAEREFSRTADGVIVNQQRNENGRKMLCAFAKLEDGCIISYYKEASVWLNAVKDSVWLFLLIVGIAVIFQFVIVYRAVSNCDNMVESIMHVLSDFTEGNFASRIIGVTGVSPSVAAKYNSIFARVQDRVFSQQKRNRVVSQMLNQMKNGIITVDTEMNVSYATNAAGELFGVSIKDAEGMPVLNVFKNEALEDALREAVKQGTGNMFTADIEAKQPDGSIRPMRIYASPLFREGKCTGALAAIEDITEIRKLEQLRTDFAANVSHEMKTPLTSIKGFVETLQAGAVDNPEMARKFLNIIMIEADRLTRLINDILSITKMESGNESVEIKRIALDKAVLEVCELLKIHADEKEVIVKANRNEKPSYVMGNPDRVKQLLLNLIENGIKYNKNGGTVTVKVMEDSENVNLIVTDTGIGIRDEHLGRLFERFYRVDKGRSRAMGGTGLGLAIVKHIVNTMNGMIEVHSKYGEGTEFLVTFPKAPSEEEQPEAKDNTQQAMEE